MRKTQTHTYFWNHLKPKFNNSNKKSKWGLFFAEKKFYWQRQIGKLYSYQSSKTNILYNIYFEIS